MLKNENTERLEIIAEGLGELVDQVVFLGGAVSNLYINDPAAEWIRPTKDVDCIFEIQHRSTFTKREEELRQKDFTHCTEAGAPICRWVYKGILVDIMPTDETILGFANKWYSRGIQHTQQVKLPGGKEISILKLPYFIATKIEAYYGRKETDFRISHDIEDIINVLDGLLSFDAFQNLNPDIQKYLEDNFAVLIKDPQFLESISANIEFAQPAPGRVQRIIDFMQTFPAS